MTLYKDSLRKSGLKVTAARVAVLKILDKTQTPLDIKTLSQYLTRQKINVDQATIYRIIENFISAQLVKKIQFGDKRAYFEKARYDHHHVMCLSCGKVEDISRCSISRVEREIELTKGYVIESHSLEFFGRCRDCIRGI